MKVGVARETAPGERRVALVPDALAKLTAAGLEILVEAGAGLGALIPDSAFEAAGAKIVKTGDLYDQADVVLRVQKPSGDEAKKLRKGQAVIGTLQPLLDPQLMAKLAEAEEALMVRTREAARMTDEFVHDKPWHAIGIAAGVGLVVGMLIGRR